MELPAPWSAGEHESFFAGLFDLGFTRFVSLRILRVLYLMILVAVTLACLVFGFIGFTRGPVLGLFTLVLAGLGWVVYVALARVALEAYAVIFRIGENTNLLVAAARAERPPDRS